MPKNEYNSRNAPKFVVRLRDEEQRALIEAMADRQASSMNAVIVQAIDEKLGRGEAMDRVIEVARLFVGWQPISSAPRDGSQIILRKGDRVTAGAWVEWSKTQSHHHGTTGEYLGEDEIESGANWQSWDGGFCEDDEPTHWMSLPAAPNDEWSELK